MDGVDAFTNQSKSKVHVRLFQWGGLKKTTSIEGLSPEYNFGTIRKELKAELGCNVAVITSD